MFGLEFISVGLLHLAALETNPHTQKIDCIPSKPFMVEVLLPQDNIRYDFSKKTTELNHIGKGAYSPYGEAHSNTEFRGLTDGKQSLSHSIDFYFKEHGGKLACLQIQTIKVIMDYKPTIYISTKFQKGTPIFHKILEHEKEHVRITQRVLNQYSNILEKRLKNDLDSEFSTGPFDIKNMSQEQKKMHTKVKNIITSVNHDMQKESQRQHNLFDDTELDEKIKYNKSIARKLEKIFKLDN